MKISVGQFSPSGSVTENLEVVRRLAARAREEGAGLLVLPEETMFTVGLVGDDLAAAVDQGWSTFAQQLSFIAGENGLAIVAGGYESSGEARPYNTLVVIDADGRIAGTYRKIHLYDAFSYKESEHIKPGNPDVSALFRIGGLNIGVMTCYDLRFPELARRLAVEGADVLVVAAAWFAGDHKVEHWNTLLKARALENTVWVVAAGTSSDHTIGHSEILDPMGFVVGTLGDETEGLLTHEVTRHRIDEVREFLPVLANRRLGV